MTTTNEFARYGVLSFAVLLGVFPGFAAAHPAASQSQDSVAYQINADHTGSINFTGGFSGSLTQLWSVNLNGTVSYPITAKGVVYVTIGVNDGTLLDAINLSTGATLWEKLLPGSSSWADATYHRGNIYVAVGAGELLAFHAGGKPLWSVNLSTNGSATDVGAPAVGDGVVALQYDIYDQYVSAYDEMTGASIWTVNPSYNYGVKGISGGPVFSKSGVYIAGGSAFFDLSRQDGSTVWSATLGANPSDAPVLSKTDLFVADTSCCGQGDNTIFDPKTGTAKGNFAGQNAPVMLGKTLIVSLNGVLYDYSPGNGNVHWSFAGDGTLDSKPIVINGYVAALSQQGNLYLLDGSTGAQLWTTVLSYNYCCSGPDTGLGAGEGVLLVPNGGSLYAFAPQHGAKLGWRPEPTRVIGRLVHGHFVAN